LVRSHNRLRLQTGVGGEPNEKLIVADKIFKHRTVESWILRGAPQIVRTKPRNIEESVEPRRVGGEKGQRRDRHGSAEIGACGLRSSRRIAHAPILLS
jgi:hypothetical protein